MARDPIYPDEIDFWYRTTKEKRIIDEVIQKINPIDVCHRAQEDMVSFRLKKRWIAVIYHNTKAWVESAWSDDHVTAPKSIKHVLSILTAERLSQ